MRGDFMVRFFSAVCFLVGLTCNFATVAAAEALPEANEHGLITIASQFTAQETTQRLEAAIEKRGLSLIAKVQHAALAREADVMLRPTTRIIFSNAKLAGRLISESQTIRHGVTGQNPSLDRLSVALSALIVDVTSK